MTQVAGVFSGHHDDTSQSFQWSHVSVLCSARNRRYSVWSNRGTDVLRQRFQCQ